MPHWNYVDWTPRWDRGVPPGADNGHSTAISLLYVYALQRAAELEETLGSRGAGADYRAREKAVRAAVRASHLGFDPKTVRDAPDTGASVSRPTCSPSRRCGADVVQRGVMERARRHSLTPASYYFSFYVLEALRTQAWGSATSNSSRHGDHADSRSHFCSGESDPPLRHARWAAHPNYGLLATVLGVRPRAQGSHGAIAPALGSLRRAEGRVPHPLGYIEVQLVRDGRRGLRADVHPSRGLSGVLEWQGEPRNCARAGYNSVEVSGDRARQPQATISGASSGSRRDCTHRRHHNWGGIFRKPPTIAGRSESARHHGIVDAFGLISVCGALTVAELSSLLPRPVASTCSCARHMVTPPHSYSGGCTCWSLHLQPSPRCPPSSRNSSSTCWEPVEPRQYSDRDPAIIILTARTCWARESGRRERSDHAGQGGSAGSDYPWRLFVGNGIFRTLPRAASSSAVGWLGRASVFWTYDGWIAVSMIAGEVWRPSD